MEKTHIALVGGQGAPVYNLIKSEKENIDRLVLIFSSSSKVSCITIKRLVEENFHLRVESMELDPFNPVEIKNGIERLKKNYPNDALTINVSSGSKPWSLLFLQEFSNMENTCIYFLDQNNNVWDMATCLSKTIEPLTLEEMLALEGLEIRKTDYTDFTESDKQCIAKIKEMRDRFPRQFRRIIENLSLHPNYTRSDDNGCYIEWDKFSNEFHCYFEKINTRKLNVTQKEYTLSSPHIRQLLLNTGWFELEVAQVLAKWSNAQHIWNNCIIHKTNDNMSLNEIDLIVFNGTKYLYVECKTQVNKITDVDKFNNLKTYSGLSIKRIFVTETEMKAQAEEKCKAAKIPYFSMADIKARGEDWFFSELDKIMKRIDTK